MMAGVAGPPLYKFKPFSVISIKPKQHTKNGEEPKPRSGHRVVCYGYNMYSFGGYNPKIETSEYKDERWQQLHPLFQELWQFNTLSEKWTRLCHSDRMPLELASHAAVISGDCMLVYGGTAMPFGDSCSNKLNVCHLSSGEWSQLQASGMLPVPMYGQAVCLKDNILYVVGGTTGFQYCIDVHCFNLSTKEWKQLFSENSVPVFGRRPYVPAPRYRHEVIEHKGTLMVFGGGQTRAAFDLQCVPTFNLSLQKWSTVHTYPDVRSEEYPEARRCHILLKDGKSVYIHGGYTGNEAFRNFWCLNLETLTWQKLRCFTKNTLHFHAASMTEDGCMYIFGGVSNLQREQRTNEILKLWVRIPPLLLMSWEALCHYAPHIPHLPASVLYQAGIPLVIVDALHQDAPAYG